MGNDKDLEEERVRIVESGKKFVDTEMEEVWKEIESMFPPETPEFVVTISSSGTFDADQD